MNAQVRLTRMVRASADVLVHPQSRLFRSYAARGSDSDALTYVAIAAFATIILQMLSARGGSAIGLLSGVVNQLFNFYIFAGVAYFVSKQQGGLGNFEEVAYAFALFYVPVTILIWLLFWLALLLPFGGALLPWLWLVSPLGLLAQVFYGVRAVRGVMNFRSNKEPLTAVVLAILALWVLQLAFSGASFAGG